MIQPKADIPIDPEYTGDFFRQTLPDGLIVETKDRIGIGLKNIETCCNHLGSPCQKCGFCIDDFNPNYRDNIAIGYKAGKANGYIGED